MGVIRAVARPMLASIFIVQGYETWRHPERVAPHAEDVVRPVREQVPALPDKTEDSVRINGAVQCVAGSFLALGWWPRLSALALAGTLVPTTLAGHRFWEVEDKQEQAAQRIQFLKNLTMLGGLLIAAADTGGDPSLAWRSRHAAQTARREVALATQSALAPGVATVKAGRATAKAGRAAVKAGTAQAPRKAAAQAGTSAAKAGAAAGKAGATAAKAAGKAATQVAGKASQAAARAGKAAARAGQAGGKVSYRTGRTVGQAKGKAKGKGKGKTSLLSTLLPTG
jgi:putative oxidoreductase